MISCGHLRALVAAFCRSFRFHPCIGSSAYSFFKSGSASMHKYRLLHFFLSRRFLLLRVSCDADLVIRYPPRLRLLSAVFDAYRDEDL